MTFDRRGPSAVAIITPEDAVIYTAQDALDLMAGLFWGEESCPKLAIDSGCLSPEFFDLKTGLAGDILQKYSNYRVSAAIVGDFSGYRSKALQDFIRESNRGSCIYFAPSWPAALDRLHSL